MKLLNLGCGHRYSTEWTNVDFVSTGPGVQAHNLLQGVPFADNTFDAVYHSHVLEHFTKTDAVKFIAECYRVLKPGGTLRIAIPDLERIAKLYVQNLEDARKGVPGAADNYNWIMLEMYDQTVRSVSGGNMLAYLQQNVIPNEEFVYERIGNEGRDARQKFLAAKQSSSKSANKAQPSLLRRLLTKSFYLALLKKVLFSQETADMEKNAQYLQLGRFRLGGEIHQWMYDSYSLQQLLQGCGLKQFTVRDAFTSNIPNWNTYALDSKDGVIHKPDSLFVEATK